MPLAGVERARPRGHLILKSGESIKSRRFLGNREKDYKDYCENAGVKGPVRVRRDKAAFSSGCKPHPATAPAGTNRSSHGSNEMAEAFGWRVTNW